MLLPPLLDCLLVAAPRLKWAAALAPSLCDLSHSLEELRLAAAAEGRTPAAGRAAASSSRAERGSSEDSGAGAAPAAAPTVVESAHPLPRLDGGGGGGGGGVGAGGGGGGGGGGASLRRRIEVHGASQLVVRCDIRCELPPGDSILLQLDAPPLPPRLAPHLARSDPRLP